MGSGAPYRFNATTAFLLRGRAKQQKGGEKSFNATTAFLLLIRIVVGSLAMVSFQCHHGVPASSPVRGIRCRMSPVSMPPRRSCFGAVGAVGAPGRFCFNATTAFLLREEVGYMVRFDYRFNATTAFLLRATVWEKAAL